MKEKFRTAGRNDSRKSDNNIVPEKPANKVSKNYAGQLERIFFETGDDRLCLYS